MWFDAIDKEKLKKKLQKDLHDEMKHTCVICRNLITLGDISDLNFEYVKNKLGESYAHSSCIKYQRKVETDAENI